MQTRICVVVSEAMSVAVLSTSKYYANLQIRILRRTEILLFVNSANRAFFADGYAETPPETAQYYRCSGPSSYRNLNDEVAEGDPLRLCRSNFDNCLVRTRCPFDGNAVVYLVVYVVKQAKTHRKTLRRCALQCAV